jgi:hypothetical protein
MPPANRTRDDESQPEQVAAGTVREARDEIGDATGLRLGLLHHAELARPEGARRSVIEDIARRRTHLDQQAIEQGVGYTRSHDDMLHFALLRGVDYSLVRATFDFLGRERVTESELDDALAHVSNREV